MRERLWLSVVVGLIVVCFGLALAWLLPLLVFNLPPETPIIMAAGIIAAVIVFIVDIVWRRK